MPVRTIRLNGEETSAEYQSAGTGDDQASEPLLYWLRERLGQYGPRFGCGVSQCGACTVLVDGVPTRSCVTDVHTVPDGAEVRTLDGLAENGERHPLQKAFVRFQAGQCAFCVNGMVMGALGWLEGRIAAGNRAVPSADEIRDFLSGAGEDNDRNYLCRCGTHTRITAAIRSAAEEMVR
ncbi:(2Fe-2S)-binding protein [Streptomyces odontomachi]|uniref:(2Fe-2S)-binding protein n=1 Tax=Streptomyces odontomachi TaxID=2944940 RepID=UPI00210DE7C6|nr:2Fe-2S iron-sulfur cluster-binding protein [Streptomyces sp. ODS25]